MSDTTPVKRIRLTIEWVGQCSEDNWIGQLWETIEDCDFSRTTRVVNAECLTHHGRTEAISREELVALGYKPRKPGPGFWEVLRWRLRRWRTTP